MENLMNSWLIQRSICVWAMTIGLLASPVVRAADVPVSGAPPMPDITPGGQVGPGVPQFDVAPGLKVTVAIDAPSTARNDGSRFLEFDSFNNLYVSFPISGRICTYKLQPDGSYKFVAAVVTGKRTVHGMCFFDGWLWYTTSGGIFKGKAREDGTALDEMADVIPDDGTLPKGGGHWWRSILVDHDGFYTSIGDTGNLNDLTKTDRQKIWRYSLDGKTRTQFVGGIRNTEKLRFRPGTEEVWGCDHGSDNFGQLLGDVPGNQPITDRLPGEEINHYVQGKFYGHPFVVDANLIRPEFANRPDIKEIQANSTPPEFMLPAHFADCGWNWLTKDSAFGKKGDMVITSHGSWNSTKKVGYCVSILKFDEKGKPVAAHKIVSCISADATNVMGRPVDVVEELGTDNLLFSVDTPRGKLYRISPVPAQ
jgi:glucose/arabinose dehydrogenase